MPCVTLMEYDYNVYERRPYSVHKNKYGFNI